MLPYFAVDQVIIYPAHGVGTISSIEPFTLEVPLKTVKLYVIDFPRNKMVVRVPVNRPNGMRALSDNTVFERVFKELIRPREKSRRFWNQRVLGYKADLCSGDLVKTAILARNLYATDQERLAGKQSYSEHEIYEAAFTRIADELAAATKYDQSAAEALIDEVLATKHVPPELKKL